MVRWRAGVVAQVCFAAVVVVVAAVGAATGSVDAPADDAADEDATVVEGERGVPEPTGEPPAAAEADPAAVEVEPALAAEPVASLTSLAANPGTGDLFVAELTGGLRLVQRIDEDGATVPVLDPEPVLDLSDEVAIEGEQGLLGIAFDDDGEHLYLSYTAAGDGALEVVEYALDGNEPDEASRRALLSIEEPTVFHNGGQLAIGPDGMLWIGVGDGGHRADEGGDDTEVSSELLRERLVDGLSENAQDLDLLLGKLLRIDPTPDGDAPYTIPADNPYADGGGRPEIWANGLRNPWRFAFDPGTGDLWVADVGGGGAEEVNVLRAEDDLGPGANYGWDQREGYAENEIRGDPGPNPPYLDPDFAYSHDDGRCAIIGGGVYRGARLPGLVGSYLFADLCEGRLRALVPDGDGGFEEVLVPGGDLGSQPTALGFGTDGEPYAVNLAGQVLRIDPASS